MKKILFMILALSVSTAFGQVTVTVDPNFNITDIGNGAGDGPGSGVDQVIKLSSGKMLAIGNFSKYNNTQVAKIARINEDGSLDSTFNQNGIGIAGSINSAVIQNDGKIIIAGSFTAYNGTNRSNIARLNADGTLDASFNPGSGFTGAVSAVKLQADGKIIAGGNFTMYDDYDAFRLVRINTNGSIDTTFDTSLGVGGAVSSLEIDASGKVLIAGNFLTVNGVSINRVARLLPDASLDTSFNIGTGANGNVSGISLQNDKIYIYGSFLKYNDVTVNRIARLNQDGSQDTSFSTGTAFNDGVYKVFPSTDKLIAVGNFTTYQGNAFGRIVRLFNDGSVDTSFNPGNAGAVGSVMNLVDLGNNNYMACGYYSTFNGVGKQYLTKFSEDGAVDINFNKGIGVSRDVYQTAILDDKSIVFGGAVTLVNNNITKNLAKTDAEGNLDLAFISNLGSGFNNTVTGVKKLSNGKILVTGDFTTFNGADQLRAVMINTDGTKDNSFQSANGFNNSISATAETADGKIIFAGSFTSYAGTAINRIARLNSDGTLDTSFAVGTGSPSAISAVAAQPDGKVIIGGSFTSFNGTASINRFVRLNADGSIDTTFNVGTAVNFPVLAIALQPDGKIIIGGSFSNYNGTAINRIARLNSDGTLDNSFSVGTGLNSAPSGIMLQNDGKIIMTGDFASYNGTAVSRIFRVKVDGSLDSTFNIGTGANGTIRTVAFQDDTKLIIGGSFNNFGGVGKNRLARLIINDGSLAVSDQLGNRTAIMLYPNPARSIINIKSDSKAISSRIYNFTGRTLMQFSGNIANVEELKPGIYFIQSVFENGQTQNQKLIKQ